MVKCTSMRWPVVYGHTRGLGPKSAEVPAGKGLFSGSFGPRGRGRSHVRRRTRAKRLQCQHHHGRETCQGSRCGASRPASAPKNSSNKEVGFYQCVHRGAVGALHSVYAGSIIDRTRLRTDVHPHAPHERRKRSTAAAELALREAETSARPATRTHPRCRVGRIACTTRGVVRSKSGGATGLAQHSLLGTGEHRTFRHRGS